ncbi:MAG TPA: hypothetical protein VI485_09500 [Vicinamibacterales bacterium]|nr:hypothetical protein [Vicinamibacterales bacterium]
MDLRKIAKVALLTPLFAGAAVAVVPEAPNWPGALISVPYPWILVSGALIAAVVVPGMVAGRITRSNRFASGLLVAIVGWAIQLVTGTLLMTAATGSDMAGVSALMLSILGMLTGVVTGLFAVLSGMVQDRQRAV